VTAVDDRGSWVRFSRLSVPAQTTMTRSLPPEILDLIVDHLCGEPTTLKACCLVSKSWVPRSRRHLFSRVTFNMFWPSITFWMTVFPDPLTSPAHYTRTLTVTGLRVGTVTNNDVTPWIRAFRNVVHLHVKTLGWSSPGLFRGLSPIVRSLHLEAPNTRPSAIFDVICSFPLLEDLALFALSSKTEDDDRTTPPTLPRLVRSLLLSGWINLATRRLLDVPNDLHLTKLTFELLHETDFKPAMDLVSRCSDTLESLCITEVFTSMFPLPPTPVRYLTATN